MKTKTCLVLCTLGAGATFALAAQVVQTNDLVFGLSDADPLVSLELVRGGAAVPDFWDEPFIQAVEIDNLDGVLHNPAGNLLGVNFGITAEGGSIYNFATTDSGLDQLIGNTTGIGGEGVTMSRLGGLSVSPENTKIAVGGYDTGQVIVYDYVEGDGNGEGASLSGARETVSVPLCPQDTQGTAWLDDDTVLAFSTDGFVFEINADTMFATLETTVDTIDGCGPGVTDVEYNPEISPNIYLMYSAFTDATRNLLFVLDTDYNELGSFDYSTSMNTAREIAFDTAGNLYVSTFGGAVEVITGASDVGNLADNQSEDYYQSKDAASFNGIDVALGEAVVCSGDVDGDGDTDFQDLVALLADWNCTGDPGDCSGDIDGDGDTDFQDLVALLADWGCGVDP